MKENPNKNKKRTPINAHFDIIQLTVFVMKMLSLEDNVKRHFLKKIQSKNFWEEIQSASYFKEIY